MPPSCLQPSASSVPTPWSTRFPDGILAHPECACAGRARLSTDHTEDAEGDGRLRARLEATRPRALNSLRLARSAERPYLQRNPRCVGAPRFRRQTPLSPILDRSVGLHPRRCGIPFGLVPSFLPVAALRGLPLAPFRSLPRAHARGQGMPPSARVGESEGRCRPGAILDSGLPGFRSESIAPPCRERPFSATAVWGGALSPPRAMSSPRRDEPQCVEIPVDGIPEVIIPAGEAGSRSALKSIMADSSLEAERNPQSCLATLCRATATW